MYYFLFIDTISLKYLYSFYLAKIKKCEFKKVVNHATFTNFKFEFVRISVIPAHNFASEAIRVKKLKICLL